MKKVIVRYGVGQIMCLSLLSFIASQKQKMNTALADGLFIVVGVAMFVILIMLLVRIISNKS